MQSLRKNFIRVTPDIAVALSTISQINLVHGCVYLHGGEIIKIDKKGTWRDIMDTLDGEDGEGEDASDDIDDGSSSESD